MRYQEKRTGILFGQLLYSIFLSNYLSLYLYLSIYPSIYLRYLDPAKKLMVSDNTIKRIQKQAVIDYYNR